MVDYVMESLPDVAVGCVEVVFLDTTDVALDFIHDRTKLVEFATFFVQGNAIDIDGVQSKMCWIFLLELVTPMKILSRCFSCRAELDLLWFRSTIENLSPCLSCFRCLR